MMTTRPPTLRVLGGVLLVFALCLLSESFKLRYYTSMGPGAGFFPVWLGGILAASALWLVIRPGSVPMEPAEVVERSGLRFWSIVAALIWAAATIEWLGFIISMFVLYLWIGVTLDRKRLLGSLLLAIAGSVGVYLLFNRILDTRLPVGRLFS